MRMRLLVSAAALAAALLAPSAALAVEQPSVQSPVSPFVTDTAPVTLTWLDVADEDGYRVWRGDAACGNEADITAFGTVDVNAGVATFSDASPIEGAHCYFVEAYAGLDSEDSAGVVVVYDTTAPTGSMTAPASGATLSTQPGPITVSASAADGGSNGSGVASVEFFARTTGFPTWSSIGAPDTTAPYELAWSPSDGTYDLRALVTDNLGHTFDTTPAGAVEVDGTAPVVTLAGVATNAEVRATLALTATASDAGSGVDSVTFGYRLGSSGGFTTIGSPDTTFPYGVSFDTTGVADGVYEIRALATDDAGNALADTALSVRIDNTQPTVSLTGVADNAEVRGTLPLAASAGDAGGSGVTSVAFAYRLGSSGPFQPISTDASAPYEASFDTTAVAAGSYEIQALATDDAGNTRTDTVVNVLVDNVAPTVTLSGVTGSTSVRGSLSLGATAGDVGGSGVASVTFGYRLGSSGGFTTIGAPDTSSPYGLSFATTGVADGIYEIQALATDDAGNTHADAVVNVVVDNTVPSVALGGVASSTTVGGPLPLALSATAGDTGGSGLVSVTFGYRLGSSGGFTTIGAPDTSSPYGASFNATALADGSYEIRARALDGSGNVTDSVAMSVFIDNADPAAPSAPTGLSPVSAAPTITFDAATDPVTGGNSSGVDYYDVLRGGTRVNIAHIDETGDGSYTWTDDAASSSNPASGTATYVYTVIAVDNVGNVSVASGTRSIFLDSSAASAPIGLAALATPTAQRPQISWAAPTSPGFAIDHYNVYRGGAFLQSVGATTFTDNSSGLADGTYTYQVVAADSLNAPGIASGSIAIAFDTTAPAAPGGIAATAAIDGSVGIAWTAPSDGAGSGVARYVVRRALSASAPATTADGDATCQGAATSCADATALNGKQYSYAVFAVDRAGNTSGAGVALGILARDQLAPGAPAGLAATPGDGTVDLRWTAAAPDDDVAGYALVAKPGTSAPTSDTDGVRVCLAILAESTSCTATGLTNGATYTFGLFALDEALNRSQPATVSSAPNGRVKDAKAPAAATKVGAKVAGRTITLTWKNPADRDFDHVVITASERKPSARAAGKRVYSGKGTKAVVKLAAGQARWFSVVAYDAAGNASAPVSVRAAVAAESPFGPAPRAKVHGKVRLTWPLAKKAKYYNVQLFSGKKRIMVSWPSGRSLKLPSAKLKRGKTYTWYVWPGLGAKAKARYGKLIGKNVFTYTG